MNKYKKRNELYDRIAILRLYIVIECLAKRNVPPNKEKFTKTKDFLFIDGER